MELSEQQQLVLQMVFDAFVDAGTWPTVTRVQRLLARKSQDVDVRETLLRMPEGLATPGYLPPDQEVALTVAGLHACHGIAKEVLAYFAQAIRLAAGQYVTTKLDDSVRISAAQLRRDMNFPEFFILAIGPLISMEPYIFRSGSLGADWTIEFTDDIRRFAGIWSFDDYLHVKEQIGQRFANLGHAIVSDTVIGAQSSSVLFGQAAPSQPLLYSLLTDTELRARCLDLLSAQSHYDRAIREACVILEDRVRQAANATKTLVGVSLMEQAFGPKDGPLRLSDVSQEQVGAMQIYRGIMAYARNPAGHNLTDRYSQLDAMRFVGFVDLLLSMVERAQKHPVLREAEPEAKSG